GLVPAYLSYSGTPLNLCGLQNPQVIEQLPCFCCFAAFPIRILSTKMWVRIRQMQRDKVAALLSPCPYILNYPTLES
ncbi:hypothetical protein KKE26_01725, partial [bacterium]|nr:hypothetical protein [bacterium]